MRPRATVLVWLALLILTAAELLLSTWSPARRVVPFVGIAMALLVALTFMRLGNRSGLPAVFALAGAFWLCVMLGLGSLDSFTRHDIPVPAPTQRAISLKRSCSIRVRPTSRRRRR